MIPLLLIKSPFFFYNEGKEFTFEQPIDHFSSTNKEIFLQRYFENTKYSDPNETNIIVYIGGESELYESKIQTGSVVELAKRTKSTIYGLEHRFFGKSQPFNDLNSEHLKYLTVEQALADLAVFIDTIKRHKCTKNSCHVTVVGGSYPGALSSWFRLKYPHLADFSWSSSAPVNIQLEFPEYDTYMTKSFKSFGTKCYTKTKKYVDKLIDGYANNDTTIIKYLKNNYGVSENMTVGSLATVLSDIIAYAIQYNDRYQLMKGYCTQVNKEGVNVSYHKLFKDIQKLISQNTTEMDPFSLTDTSTTSPMAFMRAWTFMQCNQLGWFSTPGGFLHSSVDMKYYQNLCRTLFSIDLPKTDMTNRRYGGRSPASSFVVFSNGDTDPWSAMGIINKSSKEYNRKSYYIHNASHCSDLSITESDSPILNRSRERILKTFTKWMTNGCEHTCVHGQCVADLCQCFDNFGGENCDVATVDAQRFWLVGIMTMLSPILIVIVVGGSAWWIFRKIAEDKFLMTLHY